MPYAEGRVYNDADSHILETKDWLFQYADRKVRDKLAPIDFTMCGGTATEQLVTALPAILEKRRNDPAAMARAEAKILERKSWHALGGIDPGERSRALDLLGYNRQLVFQSMATTQFWGDMGIQKFFDPEILYGGARALNRGMADFCAHDRRLRGVAFVPLNDPSMAVREIKQAISEGCASVWVPATPPPDRSPTHPDMDPVWATLQDLDVPFVCHLGSGPLFLRDGFARNGKRIEAGPLGGPDEVRSKDYMVCHYGTEAFLSAMILDGVLEKFPRLRGGVIEQGALWAVPWVRKLDIAQDAFKRFEAYLNLPLRASEYAHRQLKFTPYPPEPVGWIIEQLGPEMLMFSSDFPHPEGGRDPLAKFKKGLDDYNVSEDQRDLFYTRNFAEFLGSHV